MEKQNPTGTMTEPGSIMQDAVRDAAPRRSRPSQINDAVESYGRLSQHL